MDVPGSPPPTPPPPASTQRPRPRVAWFFVGGALLLLGVAAFVVLLVLTISRASHTDGVATLPGSGEPVRMQVTAGEKRMLFAPEGQPAPSCTVADAGGTDVAVDGVSANVTVGTGGRTWKGFGTFTSPTASIEISCADAPMGQQVRVGEPLGAGFVGGILATILVPLVVGGAGLLVLLVTTILWLTRPPRRG